MRSDDHSALQAAFAEYASKNWLQPQWSEFGRETGTADILGAHPRLYRSLSWNDDDYPDAVWEIVPTVLTAISSSLAEQLDVVAEFIPDLPAWIVESGSARTRRRFGAMVTRMSPAWPSEWAEDRAAVALEPTAAAADAPRAEPAASTSTVHNDKHNEKDTMDQGTAAGNSMKDPNIFIVHGRDLPAVRDVQTFVARDTGIMPVSLADEPGRGETIIEKFEHSADDATFAIVLLTPDDVGRAKTDEVLNDRARQNVVMELGYFFAKLGRRNVAVLNAGVERPSDIDGLSYIQYPDGNWQYQLSRELKEAGFTKK
jgi:predicted nucleotide-binding protein